MTKLFTLAVAVILPVMCSCASDNNKLLDAIKQKDVEGVRTILATGRIELEPRSGPYQVIKPLAYASAYGNLEIVKMLVDAGADLNGQVAYGDVPLIKAHEHEKYDIIEFLISAGADVNRPNSFGVTPFIGLCGTGRLDLAQFAAQNGGDINSSFVASVGENAGKKNFSPLQAAASAGKLEVVEYLLSNGADPNAKDFKQRTPRELAVLKGHKEVAQLLAEAESNHKD